MFSHVQAAAAVAGSITHAVYFIHGYHDASAARIFLFYLLADVTLVSLAVREYGLFQGAATTATLSLWYFSGLFLSIAGYRLFFHPLRKFPGPVVAKLSKTIYGPYMNRSGKMHLEQDKMHQKYGDFIRTGPNELCIFSPSAHNKIHGPHSQCSKAGTAYEALLFNGEPNLDSMVDHETHRWRRQIWDKALASTTALNQYEPTVRRVVHEWLAKIKGNATLDTSLFSVLIGMEVGGQVGYSKELGVVKAGKQNTLQHLLEQLFGGVSALGHLAWPIFLVQGLGYKGDLGRFEQAVIAMTEEKEKSGGHDIMQHLLDDHYAPKPKFFTNRNMLYADAELILTASTETVGATMSYAFYHLAQNAHVRKQLREELLPLFGKTIPGEFAAQGLGDKSASYLSAVINETLRLHNPTLNEIQRTTPPQGLDVDGVHVPGDVVVSVSVYSMNRSERCFKQAQEFIPERWTTRQELIVDRGAFYPFLEGAYSCPGKRLALMTAKMVLAYTVYYYDFSFAPGEDGSAILEDERDKVLLRAGPLECEFRRRDLSP